jgi:hypothetical protein
VNLVLVRPQPREQIYLSLLDSLRSGHVDVSERITASRHQERDPNGKLRRRSCGFGSASDCWDLCTGHDTRHLVAKFWFLRRVQSGLARHREMSVSTGKRLDGSVVKHCVLRHGTAHRGVNRHMETCMTLWYGTKLCEFSIEKRTNCLVRHRGMLKQHRETYRTVRYDTERR